MSWGDVIVLVMGVLGVANDGRSLLLRMLLVEHS